MKIELRNHEILALDEALQNPGTISGSVRLRFALAKNARLVSGIAWEIRKGLEASKAERDWEQARHKLCREHAEKDGSGEPVAVGEPPNKEYKIKDLSRFGPALSKLRKEHKEGVEAQKRRREEAKDFLETQRSIEVHAISWEDFESIEGGEQVYVNAVERLVEEPTDS